MGVWRREEGTSDKPNPKTRSYIYQPPWPHMTPLHLFIQNQIPGLQKSPETALAENHILKYTSKQTSVRKLTHTLGTYYTRSSRRLTTILSVHHPHLTHVYWNPCIFTKIELALRLERDWIMSGKSCDILITSMPSLRSPPLAVLANVNWSWITMASLVWS